MQVPPISPVTQLSGNGFGQNGSTTNVGGTSAPPLCFASRDKPNTAPSTATAAPAYKNAPRFTDFLLSLLAYRSILLSRHRTSKSPDVVDVASRSPLVTQAEHSHVRNDIVARVTSTPEAG